MSSQALDNLLRSLFGLAKNSHFVLRERGGCAVPLDARMLSLDDQSNPPSRRSSIPTALEPLPTQIAGSSCYGWGLGRDTLGGAVAGAPGEPSSLCIHPLCRGVILRVGHPHSRCPPDN